MTKLISFITQSSHDIDSHLLPLSTSIQRCTKNTHLLDSFILWPQYDVFKCVILLINCQTWPVELWINTMTNKKLNFSNRKISEYDTSLLSEAPILIVIIMSYLKYVFVQQSCPKHSDALCADHSVVPSQQIQGLYLLTVHVERHRLVLHTVGYPVPSERTKSEWELTDSWALREGIVRKSSSGRSCPAESAMQRAVSHVFSSQANQKFLWAWEWEGWISLTPLINSSYCSKHRIPFKVTQGQDHGVSSMNQATEMA